MALTRSTPGSVLQANSHEQVVAVPQIIEPGREISPAGHPERGNSIGRSLAHGAKAEIAVPEQGALEVDTWSMVWCSRSSAAARASRIPWLALLPVRRQGSWRALQTISKPNIQEMVEGGRRSHGVGPGRAQKILT